MDHFDLFAPFYDRLIKPGNQDKLISLARLPVEGLLLDAGGGTGRITQKLIDYAGGLVVADLSIEMLRQAYEKDGLQTICTPTELLPFPGDIFERVIMIDAFHHVCDHLRTVNELWRVLRPGGILVIQEPDVRTIPVKLVAVVEKLALMRSHFVSPPGIKSYFENLGGQVYIERERYNSWVVAEKIHT